MLLLPVLIASFAQAVPPAAPPPTPPPMVRQAEPVLWPGAGSFGLRVGWDGGTASGGVNVGNVGLKYLINDSLALSVDLGLGISASRVASGASFALDGGVMFYLRSPAAVLRPYFPLLAGVGLINSNSTNPTTPFSVSTFTMAIAGGFGAEFWIARYFSVAGELLVRLNISNFDPVVVSFGTFAPGIHATFYF